MKHITKEARLWLQYCLTKGYWKGVDTYAVYKAPLYLRQAENLQAKHPREYAAWRAKQCLGVE